MLSGNSSQDRLILCLFGPPGVGKSTLSQALEIHYDFLQLSGGDELRRLMDDSTEKTLATEARKYILKGEPAPSELVFKALQSRLLSAQSFSRIVFDGFPRTQEHLESFPALISSIGFGQSNVTGVHLEIDIETAKIRASNRFICESCRRALPNSSCPFCGGTGIRRRDDLQESVMEARLNSYAKEVVPTVSAFAKSYQLLTLPANLEQNMILFQVSEYLHIR